MSRAVTLALALMLSGASAASAQTPTGDRAAGEGAFGDQCGICHVEAGGGQGPSLKGVIGRKAGSAPGFSFTPQLKAYGLPWTPAKLDAFLANPSQAVPGTAMPIRIPDPQARADLIAYLASNP